MKTYKFKFNILLLSFLSIILMFLLLIGVNRVFITKPSFCGILIIWLILHEVLHYIGFLLSKKVTFNDLVLGIKLERGIMYCMCKKEISKKDILVSLAMPLTVIGIITLIIGLVINSNNLIFLSIINIASSVGDIAMFLFIMKLPSDILYFDQEDEGAFYIKSKSDLSKCNNSIITQDKVDECPVDNTKIRISLLSYIILIFTIILSFM